MFTLMDKLPRSTSIFIPKSTSILTYTGKSIDLNNPEDNDFCIEDIAHSLALQCRWTGHTPTFYSVAQHSVVASYVEPAHPAYKMSSNEWDKVKLLHDAGETYYGDISTPFKNAMGDAYQVVKQPIDRCIERALLGYEVKTELYKEIVKPVDAWLLSLEAKWLMNLVIPIPDEFNYGTKCTLGVLMARCWGPDEAKERFLGRWNELNSPLYGKGRD